MSSSQASSICFLFLFFSLSFILFLRQRRLEMLLLLQARFGSHFSRAHSPYLPPRFTSHPGVARLKEMCEYTILGGKMYRAMLVINTVSIYKSTKVKEAMLVAWCVEILQVIMHTKIFIFTLYGCAPYCKLVNPYSIWPVKPFDQTTYLFVGGLSHCGWHNGPIHNQAGQGMLVHLRREWGCCH